MLTYDDVYLRDVTQPDAPSPALQQSKKMQVLLSLLALLVLYPFKSTNADRKMQAHLGNGLALILSFLALLVQQYKC